MSWLPPRTGNRDLDRFLHDLLSDRLVERIAARSGENTEAVRRKLAIFANEVPVGLRLIDGFVRPDARVLEVGAGLCLLSLFLRTQGYEVVALEPIGIGFDFFSVATSEILEHAKSCGLNRLAIPAEALAPESHGQFELIFSVHVLEHIIDLDAAFAGMVRVLSPGGTMIHLFPNYAVPYEPHFGIPLVPFLPRATAILYRRRISRGEDVWRSLNFITVHRFARLSRKHDLFVEFRRGVLYDFLRRFAEDPIFAARHRNGFVGPLFLGLQVLGLLSSMRYIPPQLATPAIAVARRRANA
jgi:2-polyprenyl-3-methyl-5-hydroxy-6-metoxy-1,4-benzoquinol methylase